MNTLRFLCFLFLGFVLLHHPIQAQQADVDAIISDLYESISFNENTDPDYDTFRSLFIDNARLISVRDTSSSRLSPQEYEEIMSRQRRNGKIIAFKEYELHRETEIYGGIMQIFSTYQTQLKTPEGSDSARGINSIQLMKENGSWKVVSLTWYEENNAHPLPEKYLPATESR